LYFQGSDGRLCYFAPVLVLSPTRFFFYSQSPRSANGLASENSAGGDFG
jgi:hypothetical protein